MSPEKVEVFVCMNVDCRSRGAEAMLAQLNAELATRGLVEIVAEPIMCFAACNHGPNVVLPGTRCWMSGVARDDVGAVVDHLQGKPIAARFQEDNDPEISRMIFEMIDAGLLDKG